MTTYAPSHTTIGVRVQNEENERPSNNWILPIIIIGGGAAGALLLTKNKERKTK